MMRQHSYTSEEEDSDDVRMDVQDVLQDFAKNTSLNGLPRIINARSMPGRVFWSVVCIFAFMMFLWTSANLLNQYYSYPKKVNVEIVQRPVTFPAVTICNTDHLDVLVVERLERFFNENNEVANENTNENTNENSNEPKPVGSLDELKVEEFLNKYSNFSESSTYFLNHNNQNQGSPNGILDYEMFEISSRLSMAANLGAELSSDVGIRAEDFIINCRFMGEKCKVNESFVKIFDPYYFNCFTFQPQVILKSRKTRLSGVEYGLSLLLFSGSAGHINKNATDGMMPGMQLSDPAVASGPGARVVLHSPDTLPHATADGYDIPSGFSVTIGVKARENVRIPPPHGNCTEIVANASYKYSLIYCQNLCIQKEIMDQCKCVDNRIPLADNNVRNLPYCLELPTILSRCRFDEDMAMDTNKDANPTQCNESASEFSERLVCRKSVYESMTIKNPDAMENCHCFPPCSDVMYDASYSLSMLPENSKEQAAFYAIVDAFLDKLHPHQKKKLPKVRTGTNLDKVKSLVSRLNVHIADSNIIKTTESPDYDLIRLVSDIGGQLGLWIGISVITLVEVSQLCADVIRILMAYGNRLQNGVRRAGQRAGGQADEDGYDRQRENNRCHTNYQHQYRGENHHHQHQLQQQQQRHLHKNLPQNYQHHQHSSCSQHEHNRLSTVSYGNNRTWGGRQVTRQAQYCADLDIKIGYKVDKMTTV